MGNFESEKGPAQYKPRHVRRSTYAKRVSRRQHWYGADVDCNVLDVRAHWRPLGSAMELPVCGADAAMGYVKLV